MVKETINIDTKYLVKYLFDQGVSNSDEAVKKLISCKSIDSKTIQNIINDVQLSKEQTERILDILNGKVTQHEATPSPSMDLQHPNNHDNIIEKLLTDPRLVHLIQSSLEPKADAPSKAVTHIAPRPPATVERLSLPIAIIEEVFNALGYSKENHSSLPGLAPIGALFRAIFGEHEFSTQEDIALKIASLTIPAKYVNLWITGFYRIILDYKEHLLALSNSEKDPRSAPEIDSLLKARKKQFSSRRPPRRSK